MSTDNKIAEENKNTLANSLIEHKSKLSEYETELNNLSRENETLKNTLNNLNNDTQLAIETKNVLSVWYIIVIIYKIARIVWEKMRIL